MGIKWWLDNNKIVDNLNLIKIYFKGFIYKIIILKKPELSRKEIRNHKRRMKTCLGTRTGQKTLEEESKWHPNTKTHSASESQFSTFGVPNGTLKVLNCHSGDDKAHPFQPFCKRRRLDLNPNRPYLFFRVFRPL